MLRQIADLAEVCARRDEPRTKLDPTYAAIGRRLREWSRVARLQADFSVDGGFPAGYLASRIAALEPTDETILWFTEVAPIGPRARWWILHALPDLMHVAAMKGVSLNGAALEHAYQVAGNLYPAQGELHLPKVGDEFAAVNIALLGEGKKNRMGLLQAAPERFVPLALMMMAGFTTEEQEDSRRHVEEMFANLQEELDSSSEGNSSKEDEHSTSVPHFLRDIPGGESAYQTASDALRISGTSTPTLRGDLRSDAYWEYRRRGARALVHGLQTIVSETATRSDEGWNSLWAAIENSTSTLGRIIVLDELISESISVHDEVIDSILAHPDLYAVTETAPYIGVALRRRWPEWNESVRAAILNNIMNGGYSDADPILARIDLLSAIPENDVPPAFVPLLSLLRDKGWTGPKIPGRHRSGSAAALELDDEMRNKFLPLPAALSPECAERWRALRLSESIDAAQGTSSLDDMIVVARSVVDCLPAPAAISGALWMMHSVIRVLHHLREHRDSSINTAANSALTANELDLFWAWFKSIIDPITNEDFPKSEQSLKPGTSFTPLNHPWAIAMEGADATLSLATGTRRREMVDEYFAEVARRRSILDAPLLRQLLINTSQWFATSESRILLHDFLVSTRSGVVLHWSLPLVQGFGPVEQQLLFRQWLTADVLPRDEGTLEFAGDAGQFYGAMAVNPNEQSPSLQRKLAEEWLADPPRTGLLADPTFFWEWATGLAFGVNEVLRVHVPSEFWIIDYSEFMESIWSGMSRAHAKRPLHKTFSLFAFAPLFRLDRAEVNSTDSFRLQSLWWKSLTPFLVRVLREGDAAEVNMVTFNLRDAQALVGTTPAQRGQLADVLRDRVDSDGPALMATPRASGEEGWDTALEYGCKLLAEIGVAADTSEELRSKVFGILTTWAAPPLSIRGALDGAQRVRKRVI